MFRYSPPTGGQDSQQKNTLATDSSVTTKPTINWASDFLDHGKIPILLERILVEYSDAVQSCHSFSPELVLFGEFRYEGITDQISDLLAAENLLSVWVGVVYDSINNKWTAMNGTNEMVWQHWANWTLRFVFVKFN